MNPCGAQRNIRAVRLLYFFDRYAFSHSLLPPPAAVVRKATKLSHTPIFNCVISVPRLEHLINTENMVKPYEYT